MYKWICFLAIWVLPFSMLAQTADELRESARAYQKQGDYNNAILVLNKASNLEPQNIEIKKELAIAFYLGRQYPKAIDVIKPVVEGPSADEQSFQIAALLYKAADNFKEAEKQFKAGLKKFPTSGTLYYEYGNLVDSKDPGMGKGISFWERGIEADPEYPGNYFNATKHYSNSGNAIWTMIYGEMFVNLESFTARTTEVKNILLEEYKKLFAYGIVSIKTRPGFETEWVNTLNKQTSLSKNGIGAEALTAIRARFILDWFHGEGKNYPFKLFDLHRQLLQDGLFDSYNQWLFGSVENMVNYQTWTTNHQADYASFNQFQRSRLFKIPSGQYYNK